MKNLTMNERDNSHHKTALFLDTCIEHREKKMPCAV